MKIGFTGTRQGMTPAQTEALVRALELLYGIAGQARVEFHHGDCAGADAQAHGLVATTYGLVTDIHLHPPTNQGARAFCDQRERPEGKRAMTLVVHPPKPYLERNHDIGDACDILVAVPKEDQEVLRSGTWATVRYVHKLQKQVMVIYTNGTTSTALRPGVRP